MNEAGSLHDEGSITRRAKKVRWWLLLSVVVVLSVSASLLWSGRSRPALDLSRLHVVEASTGVLSGGTSVDFYYLSDSVAELKRELGRLLPNSAGWKPTHDPEGGYFERTSPTEDGLSTVIYISWGPRPDQPGTRSLVSIQRRSTALESTWHFVSRPFRGTNPVIMP
jgi:hypothetical protein